MDSQAVLVDGIVTAFLAGWNKPFDDQFSEEGFLELYHPRAEWYDHAFHVCRIGREAILGLRTSFLHCNQPFTSELKSLLPTPGGAVVEQLWVGCCANDIVRPDGQIAVKGTGKEFKAHVCVVLRISDEDLITRIDEYYNRAWDEGVQETGYTVVKGSFSKI